MTEVFIHSMFSLLKRNENKTTDDENKKNAHPSILCYLVCSACNLTLATMHDAYATLARSDLTHFPCAVQAMNTLQSK